MNKMSLTEAKSKILVLLGSNDEADVAHITQEMLDKDELSTYDEDADADSADTAVDVIEGHNVRYYYKNGVYGYSYERGISYSGAGCGNGVTRWLPFSAWNATSIGRCTGNDHLVRFTRK